MKLIGNEIIDDFTGEVVLDIHDDYVYKSYLVNRLAKETFMRTPELFATPPFHRYVEEVTKDFDLNSEYKTASEIYDNIDYVLFPTTQELCRYQSLYPEHARKFGQIEWSIEGSWRAPTPLGHAETTGASPATVRKRADICLMASQELFNFDGVHFLLRDIMPKVWNRLPGSKLIIAGAVCGMIRSDFEFADCSFANIELLPAFDDPNAIYERADIVVAPLRYGTGLSIKLVEALKAGKAIVTTSTGCRGVPLRDGQHALIRDCADDFASALIELLADTSARTELAGQAFVFGKARYSQSSLISGLDRLLAGR
jgi:glycosyltransferase involved in cell wall biosynthesis